MVLRNAGAARCEKFKNSSVYDRPSSSLSVGSTSSVMPVNASHDGHMTEMHSSHSISDSKSSEVDYSIFTVPPGGPVSPPVDRTGRPRVQKPVGRVIAPSAPKRTQVAPVHASTRSSVVENFISESFKSPDLKDQSGSGHAMYSDDII